MDARRKPDEERRRNALSIRWSDSEHRALVDAAWRRRIPASALVRQYVAEGLRRDGAAGAGDADALVRRLGSMGGDEAAAALAEALGPLLGQVGANGGGREGCGDA